MAEPCVEGLAATGGEPPWAIIIIAAVLVIGGAILLLIRRRRGSGDRGGPLAVLAVLALALGGGVGLQPVSAAHAAEACPPSAAPSVTETAAPSAAPTATPIATPAPTPTATPTPSATPEPTPTATPTPTPSVTATLTVDCAVEWVVLVTVVNGTGEMISIGYEVSRDGEPFGGDGFDVLPNSTRTIDPGFGSGYTISVRHGDDDLLTTDVPGCPVPAVPEVSAFSSQTCEPTPDLRVAAWNDGGAGGSIRYDKVIDAVVVATGEVTVEAGASVDVPTGFGDGPFTIVLTDQDGQELERYDVSECVQEPANPFDLWATFEAVCSADVGVVVTVGSSAVFESGTATIERVSDGVTVSSQTVEVPGGESVVTRFAPEPYPYEINVIQQDRVTNTFTIDPCAPELE